MHVVIVSDLETRGGAALATTRLAAELADQSVRVTRVVAFADPHSGDRHWKTVEMVPRSIAYRALRRLLHSRQTEWRAFGRWFSQGRLKRLLTRLSPDVINVHNIHMAEHDGWSARLLDVCCRISPTVWTLHDMWSFTGGCNYAYDCTEYIAGCGQACLECVDHQTIPKDRLTQAWALRRAVLRDNPDLVAVSPSAWLSETAQEGLWDGHRVEVIPNPIPLDTYSPLERSKARARLGMDPAGLVLLIVGWPLDSYRRGPDLLAKALERCDTTASVFLTMGTTLGDAQTWLSSNVVTVKHLGPTQDEDQKSLIYNAADVLIHASRADNLPNAIAEALACGTPVVAFDVGGISELVQENRSGWLAEEHSSDSLAETLSRALAEIRGGRDLRASSRELAEQTLGQQFTTDRYVGLFASLPR